MKAMKNNYSSMAVLASGLALAGIMASCKPQELQYMDRLGRDVVLHQGDITVQLQLQKKGMLVLPEMAHTYYWYDKGKVNSSQAAYSGKVLHGLYREYDRAHKMLLVSGRFHKGLKQGRWLSWNAAGRLRQAEIYRDGELNGALVKYDSLGRPADTLNYRNGVLRERRPVDSHPADTTARKGLFNRLKAIFKGKGKHK
ncbi:hypothetical protein [Pedobacter sp. JY14-1]|uniref:toxin-antitoxin system YwqK family antitoxin n=1 Tax=Pedobacter sp. JY14-1 TaxID=3034151 RepID=UPI0023E20B01|nr:hypothetical protein [Pedobacter sp. JY14-1]